MNSNQFSFRGLSFEERMITKDNPSQKAFNTFCNRNNITAYKFGVDGTEEYKPYEMKELVRDTPDKICYTSSGDQFQTEIKGCNNSGLRIKKSKMTNYFELSKLHKINFFIWNSETKKYAFIPIKELYSIALQIGTSFDSSMGEIYHIHCKWLDWSDAAILHVPNYADNYNK